MKRLLCILLSCVMLLSLAGCGNDDNSIPTIMDDGAYEFALGKDEENYALQNSGALLEELIDDFSGSYYIPSQSEMDDDAYDDALDQIIGGGSTPDTTPEPDDAPDTTPAPDETPDETPDITPAPDETPDTTPAPDETPDTTPTPAMAEVGSWDDFLHVFHDAYNNTAEYVQFQFVNGYTLDLGTALQECYTELQREDPIDVSGVEQWSWGMQGNEYLVEIDYFYDIDAFIQMKQDTETLLDQAVASIDVSGMSDYEIVCAVNNYLCDTVYYPESEPYAPVTHTAYGAFHDGVAVCEGYACAAKLMLNEYGVLCDIQVGDCYEGGGHAWNLVQLDGQWYQMDVTWNDGGGDREAYLLVTDDYMKVSRYWDESKYPACATTAYQP